MCVVSRCFSVYITYRGKKTGRWFMDLEFFFLLLLFSSPEDVLPSNVNILLNMLIYFLYSHVQQGWFYSLKKKGVQNTIFFSFCLGRYSTVKYIQNIYSFYLMIRLFFFTAESIFFFEYYNSGILHWNQQNIICLSVRISFWKK